MPSPFPGMNPFLEQDAFWQDFHLEFLPAIRERLVAQVRPKYIIMLDEHVYAQDVRRVPFLEVRDRLGRELITVLELLSPANKRGGADREQYMAKREQLLSSAVHFLEIDLLRGGRRMPLENRRACDYSVLVSRAEDRPRAGFWPIRLRQRLPIVPVPLQSKDPDARIDLQEVFHDVYDAAGYDDFIYAGRPNPQLSAKDATWARTFLPRKT
jgi:hypothetical protein